MVYKYWAEPRGELPAAVWAHAHTMREVWNALAEMREGAAREAAEASEDEAREVWVRHQLNLTDYSRSPDVAGRLNWAAREFVFDRFREAALAASKRSGTPRPRRRLDSIIIPHRFTDGGVPPARLFSDRPGRVRLHPLPAEAYADARRETVRGRITRGEFRLGDETIVFSTILHRPIPADSVVKGFAWCGKRHPTKGWRWSINITVEQPPYPRRIPTGRVCALDLGWRVMGAYLRVGVLGDSSGNLIELRLPLADTGTSFTRRYGLPDSFKDVRQMGARLDTMVDECKGELKGLLPEKLPDGLRELASPLGQARQGGLIRLLRALEQQVESGGREFEGALGVLRNWLERNDALRRRRLDTLERLKGRRRWLYGNLAAWLAASYDRIIWEGDLRVSVLSVRPEHSAGGYALENSRKYRDWAAVGELRGVIRRAVVKAGGELIDGGTAYSTVTCAGCGARCEPSEKLFIECDYCGRRFDQDVNAAKNLLAGSGVVIGNAFDPPRVPGILRDCLVPFSD